MTFLLFIHILFFVGFFVYKVFDKVVSIVFTWYVHVTYITFFAVVVASVHCPLMHSSVKFISEVTLDGMDQFNQ